MTRGQGCDERVRGLGFKPSLFYVDSRIIDWHFNGRKAKRAAQSDEFFPIQNVDPVAFSDFVRIVIAGFISSFETCSHSVLIKRTLALCADNK